MKYIIKRLITIILLAFFIVSLTSCDLSGYEISIKYKISKNSDFYYILSSAKYEYDKSSIKILGLSENLKKSETIIFPQVIDGKFVEYIGSDETIGYGRSYYNLKLLNQKNIYFNSYNRDILVILGRKTDIKVFFPLYTSHYFYENNRHLFLKTNKLKNNIIFISNRSYNITIHGYSKSNVRRANVSYYIDKELNTYFIDDVDNEKIKNKPPIPFKENYEFKGWFKDKNFEKLFDFEKDIIPKKIYDKNGRYIYKENKLFAKWENIITGEVYEY